MFPDASTHFLVAKKPHQRKLLMKTNCKQTENKYELQRKLAGKYQLILPQSFAAILFNTER